MASISNPSGTDVTVCHLRCEYRENPVGIDVSRPRLRWVLESSQRGIVQTAYQVLVASSEARLASAHGNLWDSGIVESAQSSQVEYDGPHLPAGTHCYWKVRVWSTSTCTTLAGGAKHVATSDAGTAVGGQPSEWSESASWSVGLLGADEWNATWIGYDAAYEPTSEAAADDRAFNIRDLKWLAYPGKLDSRHKAGPTTYLRKRVNIPHNRPPIRRAVLALYAFHTCTASVNGTPIGESFHWERTARLDATHKIHTGANLLALTLSITDPEMPAAVGRLVVQFTSGPDLVVPLDETCRVSKEVKENWTALDLDDSDGTSWHAAAHVDSPSGSPSLSDLTRAPVPYLRTEFTLDNTEVKCGMRRATLYATALGAYEIHLNGKRVGNDVLTPGWPEFLKRVPYQTYDVTALLVAPGRNAIGAILGDGWYASDMSFLAARNHYGGRPRLMAQLVVEYSDDSSEGATLTETIGTDATWKAGFGPILHADLLLGCEVDARRQIAGWDSAGFDDSDWKSVVVNGGVIKPIVTDPSHVGKVEATDASYTGVVEASVSDSSRVLQELPVVSMTMPKPGCYTFDLGQVIAGWVRFKVRDAAGHRITLRHGETVNSDGSVYTANLRSCTATDFYTPAGNDEETFEPMFTFHGFRYVEVRGLPTAPNSSDMTGLVVHSPLERTGLFECSNSLLNKLYSNIIWGQRSNYFEAPTDCPQRDERLGWTGDTQFFIPTAAYNFDVASFISRWLTSCRDAQHENGQFPHVVPDVLKWFGSTAWGDAALICAHHMYRVYGDTRLLAEHFDAMERYMHWLSTKTTAGISKVDGYGDWVNIGGGADGQVIDTAYHAYLATIMSEMAAAIGKTAEAQYYSALHASIKAAFVAAFIEPDGAIKKSSQTGYALAFTMDMVPAAMRDKMAAKFAAELARFDNHLATGFIGTPRLLPGLRAAGLEDLAHQVLLNETYPSWLSQVKLGATTTWERWNSWTPDDGFGPIGMNSFNHYAFGSVGEYMYSAVGGIQLASPGYHTIDIHPVTDRGLTWAATRFDCPHGRIATRWERNGTVLTLSVTIPANTTATVYVPVSSDTHAAAVTEGAATNAGGPTVQSPGVTFLRTEPGAAVFKVGSGEYTFYSKH